MKDIELESVKESSDNPLRLELSKEDRNYLEKIKQRIEDREKFSSISKLKINPEVDKENTYNITAENLAGVVQLPSGTRIQIDPKIENIYLIKMWSYAYLDRPIDHESLETVFTQGTNYFDFLALILHQEIQKIFRRGLYKTYIRKKDKREHLKGKLLINKQINQIHKNKFNVEYEELSKDNKANKILLKSLSISRKAANSDQLRRKLSRDYRQLRKEGVTETGIKGEQLEFKTDRKNKYYQKSLTIAEHIINDIYYEEIDLDNLENTTKGYSLLFNTYEIFEAYIQKIADESLSEDVRQGKQKFLESERGGRVNAEPDLVIGSNLETYYGLITPKTVEAVGDIKYKTKPNNSNHYQALAYGMINQVNAFLIYPSSDDLEPIEYHINNSDKINTEIPFKTSLLGKENYIEASKDYLKSHIEKFLKLER